MDRHRPVWVRVHDDGMTSVELRAVWPEGATYDDVMATVVRAVGKLAVAAQAEGLTPPPDWVALQ